MNNKKKYEKCEYCLGPVHEKTVTVDLRIKKRLFVFENVPVGVCQRCGERYYRGPVLERLEELSQHEDLCTGKIKVPKFDFSAIKV